MSAMKGFLLAIAVVVALALVPGVAAEPASAPCEFGQVPHPGFDCTVAGLHCAFFIWVDLNPPNPTFDCLL